MRVVKRAAVAGHQCFLPASKVVIHITIMLFERKAEKMATLVTKYLFFSPIPHLKFSWLEDGEVGM